MITIGVVGATGLTGEAFTKILFDKLGDTVAVRLFAGTSAGTRVQHGSRWITVESIDAAMQGELNYAVFMTPQDVSAKYAPLLAARGVICIDNSPCFRNDKNVPLVVRQINGEQIGGRLIANPNCVTIQVAIALNALLHWQPKRLTVATYQSASGAGKEGLADLTERRTIPRLKAFDNQIFDNVLPKIGEILSDGYTVEEHKMQDELQKIFGRQLSVNCFAARVPVTVGHCAFVNVELEKPFALSDVVHSLKNQPNVLLLAGNNATPRILCHTKYVAIGRIVEYLPTNSVNMFVVADNLLRGAAYNAFEILQQLLESGDLTEKTNRNVNKSDTRPCNDSTQNDSDRQAKLPITSAPHSQNTTESYTINANASEPHKQNAGEPHERNVGTANARSLTNILRCDTKPTALNALLPKCTSSVDDNASADGTQTPPLDRTLHCSTAKMYAYNATTNHTQNASEPHARNASSDGQAGGKNPLLITALATPFCNGRIHYPSVERLLATQYDVDAVVACGTTGEGHLLRDDERTRLIRFIKATAPQLSLWAAVTQTCTAQAVRQAEAAAKIGASALLVCPPIFVGCTPQGFLQHVKAIFDATRLPICLYNVPHRCGYSLNTNIIQRLTESEVKYVKDCTADIQMRNVAGGGLLCGCDGLLTSYLQAGARGVVGVVSNAAPQLSRLALRGDTDCQTLFREVARLLEREPNPICIKYLLYRLQIFASPEVRLPLTPPSAPTKTLLDSFVCKYREILR